LTRCKYYYIIPFAIDFISSTQSSKTLHFRKWLCELPWQATLTRQQQELIYAHIAHVRRSNTCPVLPTYQSEYNTLSKKRETITFLLKVGTFKITTSCINRERRIKN